MYLYHQQTTIPRDYAKRKIEEFLLEDIPGFDKTTKGIFSGNEMIQAVVQAEEDLVFAGGVILDIFFDNHNSQVNILVPDGIAVQKGQELAEIIALAPVVLSRERVLLNLLQRMSGVATLAKKYSEIAKPYDVKILDTRKTTPGLRLFEKYAVCVGGCYNHRMDLSSGILIKDNHIKAAGGVKNAVFKIKSRNYGLPIELEVENFEQLTEGIESGADGFLLDNMRPDVIKEAVNIIRNSPGGKDIFIEASGGINLENLEEYVKTGVDAISAGALTHSVKSSNIHIELT